MLSLTNNAVKLVIFTVLMVNTEAHTWAKTVKTGKTRSTTLQFYFHDTVSGKTPTVIPVAQPTHSTRYPSGFGMLMMADDPLTTGTDLKTKMVGRAQGLYGSACQDEVGLIMVLSYNFIDGPYNGSSISIMGRNSVMHPVREMPVVGGTGLFRMARGYALAHTFSFDLKTGDAIVGYNITIVH
ncbi:hypothetical protein RND81_09G155100 [Saponaria officinalis]|uniref:Dirigent protein n=1 Tax=Saponaria officinalis TaxID=3572 RepID=A0AAW1IMZ6_SAPOF